MSLAEKLFWFQCDNGHLSCAPLVLVSHIEAQLSAPDFINDTIDYLLNIITNTNMRIARIGEPACDYEDMLHRDLIETHNRAVDLFNALMERGIA